MATVSCYLIFNGSCEKAFRYYESVFGTKISFIGRYGDIPQAEGMPLLSEEEKQKVENVYLPIGGGTFIMGADGLASMGYKPTDNRGFSLYVTAESREEADRLFHKLSANGQATMPISQAHWGDYFGMCTDQFGISWFINFAAKQ